jgi:hypothetical protein
MSIPEQIRAKLKRLSAYASIPEPVREAKHLYPDEAAQYTNGWYWANSSRCSLALCDLDSDHTDVWHVSLCPMKDGKCSLRFVIGPKWPEGIYPGIIFPNMQEAKRCADSLLATSTPPIPAAPPVPPWANHVITGLKNPKFFQRKVGDLSIQELQAIESQWLPKVRAVWEHVSTLQRADAEAFEAALYYFKCNPDMMSHPESNTPREIRAYLKRLCPYTNVSDTIKEEAKRLYPAHAESIDGWHWWGNVNKYVLTLCDLDDLALCYLDRDNTRRPTEVSIRPTRQGECSLTFITLVSHDLKLSFPTMQEAKRCLDSVLGAPTPEIPLPPEPVDELAIPLDTAATLKRISPYYGPVIPDLVKEKEESRSKRPYNPDENDWQWDCGSGECRWELDLCGMMDPDLVDPIGYVSLRPLEQGRCTLAFHISSSEWPEEVDDPEDLTFPSVESAKNYLDSVLAAATCPLPKPLNISEVPPDTRACLQEWYPNGEWQWCDYPGWEISLRTKGSLDAEGWGYIIPYQDGGPFSHVVKPKDWHDEWMIQFVGGCALYNFALFQGTLDEAKRCVDTLLGSNTPT